MREKMTTVSTRDEEEDVESVGRSQQGKNEVKSNHEKEVAGLAAPPQ
jgi:hypothetical protein